MLPTADQTGVALVPLVMPADNAVTTCAAWLASLTPGARPEADSTLPAHECLPFNISRCRCARPWNEACSALLRADPHVTLPLHVLLAAGEAVALDRDLVEDEDESDEGDKSGCEGKPPPATADVLRVVLLELEEQIVAPTVPPPPGADPVVHALVGIICLRLLGAPSDAAEDSQHQDTANATSTATEPGTATAASAAAAAVCSAASMTPPLSRRSPIPARYSPAPGDKTDKADKADKGGAAGDAADMRRQLMKDAAAAMALLGAPSSDGDPEDGDAGRDGDAASKAYTFGSSDDPESPTSQVTPAMSVTDHHSSEDEEEGELVEFGKPGHTPRRRGTTENSESAHAPSGGVAAAAESRPAVRTDNKGQHAADTNDSDTDEEEADEDEDDGVNPVASMLTLMLTSAAGLTSLDLAALMDNAMMARLAAFLVGHILRLDGPLLRPLHPDVGAALEVW